ncbi:MAG: hypothetical protein V3V08_20485 [Nannocystaceae bacterium]
MQPRLQTPRLFRRTELSHLARRSRLAQRLIGACIAALWPILATLGCSDPDPLPSKFQLDEAAEKLPRPKFVPSSITGSIRKIAANRLEPLHFGVADTVGGVTQLLIDTHSVGPLQAGSTLGVLDETGLTLAQSGAMRTSAHTLRLYTPGTVAPLYSKGLTITVVQARPPRLVAELDIEAFAAGTSMSRQGPPDRPLLLVVDDRDLDAPHVTLLRADGLGWQRDSPQVVSVPGYRAASTQHVPAIAATLLFDPDDPNDPNDPDDPGPYGIRVAWRVGLPGTHVDFLNVQLLHVPSIVGQATAVFTLDAVQTQAAEWATLGRLLFVGNILLTEYRIHANAEHPFPGDRKLAMSRWRAGHDAPDPPEQVATVGAMDLDALDTAIDARAVELGVPAPLSVRVGGRTGLATLDIWTRTVTVAALHEERPSFAREAINITTIVGALLSRTTASLEPDGQIQALFVDVGGRNAPQLRVLDPQLRPEAAPTGPIVATVLLGTPFFLVPYGDAAPVLAVTSTGAELESQTLLGLHCDEIAPRQLPMGDDRNTVGLACLRDGLVYSGSLTATATAREFAEDEAVLPELDSESEQGR